MRAARPIARPLLLGFALLLTGLPLGCTRTAAPPAEEKVPPAPVKWEGARQLVLEEWTELVGSTQPLPDHAARVTAPVEGRVLSVLQGTANKPIVEGQLVQKGDVLVQLDAAVLVHKRRSAELTQMVVPQAEKEAAELALKQAQLELDRLNELQKRQGTQSASGLSQLVSPIELKKAAMGVEVAQAHVKAAERKLEAAAQEIAALDHEIQLHTLTAPRPGRLGRLQVVVGQTLPIGTVVADIVDVEDEIDVLCFVPAADAGPDPEGKVEFIADQAEPDSGLLAVKVRFPNRELKLRANAVVRLRVLTRPGRACWAVPESALMEDQDPPGVVVVEDVEEKTNADGKEEQTAKARRVRAITGVRDRVLRQVEVLRLDDPEKKWHGDLESALIVVEKGQGLQTGDAVKLEVEEDEEPAPAKPEEKK